MVWLTKYQPNYEVVYRGRTDYVVHLYIAASLVEKLNSGSPMTRKGARTSVCVRFREAYKQKYGRNPGFVEWGRLSLTPWRPAPRPVSTQPPVKRRTPVVPLGDEDACDDCPSCQEGNHQRCRNACAIAASWR